MKVIVIGNGVAGNTAGSTIRHLDSQADITLLSEETHPEYSACALPYYLSGELKRQKLFIRTGKDYSREGIKTIFGRRVIEINPEYKNVLLDSRSLAYDKLIIATGSKPLVLPIQGIDLDGVFPLKSLDNADHILGYGGRTAVVVGSGPVGTETGVALHKRGMRVYLIELLDRIMPRVFDETPSSLLRSMLEEQGITVFTGERVTAISGKGKVDGIVTDKRQIECDMVILGAGMKPNIELAGQSGLKIGELGGISVTGQMMTSFSDVYACGDCVEAEDMVTGEPTLSLLWHNARQQGEVAGHNCSGVSMVYPGSQNITSLDIFGIHVASFGCPESENSRQDDIKVIEKSSGRKYHRLIIGGGRLIGAQFIGSARDMGALLSLVVRKDNLKELGQTPGINLNSWYRRAARYIAPVASSPSK
ncbi:NAD(P)/FAD-dependent oxidoreductase [Chloroflexota bacterium]